MCKAVGYKVEENQVGQDVGPALHKLIVFRERQTPTQLKYHVLRTLTWDRGLWGCR